VLATEDPVIPDKNYFKIGEVCRITKLQSHTLRFWESEFKVIKPRRVSGNQRLYRREDIEKILQIKYLLKEKGHTLAGAKRCLNNKLLKPVSAKKVSPKSENGLLTKIKQDLTELKEILEK